MAGILMNKKNHYCHGHICSGQKQQELCTFGNRKKIQKFKMTKNFGKSRKGRSLTQTRKSMETQYKLYKRNQK